MIATSSRASIKLPAPRDLQAIVVVPEFDLATERARALLPIQYDRRDVVFNIQRAALLGAALASGSWNVLREAMHDRFHQPYRGAVVPGLAEALRVDSPELIGIALSGAGPSVLAIVRDRAAWRPIAARIDACFEPPASPPGVTACPSPRGVSFRAGT